MTAGRLSALGGCCACVLCGCGGGSHAKAVVIAQRSARGLHASAVASATAAQPGSMVVRITAVPEQRVSGSWALTCRQSTSSSRDADDFAGRAPLTVAIRPFGSPGDTCTVVGTARLARSGRVKVELLAG